MSRSVPSVSVSYSQFKKLEKKAADSVEDSVSKVKESFNRLISSGSLDQNLSKSKEAFRMLQSAKTRQEKMMALSNIYDQLYQVYRSAYEIANNVDNGIFFPYGDVGAKPEDYE